MNTKKEEIMKELEVDANGMIWVYKGKVNGYDYWEGSPHDE